MSGGRSERPRHYRTCPVCGKSVRLRADTRLRQHGPANKRCAGSCKTVPYPEDGGS